jgi:hypothetical protein
MHHMSGRRDRQFKDLVRVWAAPDGGAWSPTRAPPRSRARCRPAHEAGASAVAVRSMRYPQGIHGDGAGRLAITDPATTCPDRRQKRRDRSDPGPLRRAAGLLLPAPRGPVGPYGYLFVLDTQNCRIQVYREPWSRADRSAHRAPRLAAGDPPADSR